MSFYSTTLDKPGHDANRQNIPRLGEQRRKNQQGGFGKLERSGHGLHCLSAPGPRMFPNFAHFSFDNGENIAFVKTILDNCFDFQVLRIGGAKMNLSSLKEQVKALTPNLDYEEGAASYAFDFCVALNALLSFFEKYQLAEVEIILEQAIATVDMFVQEYYNMDPSDADLEDKISGTIHRAGIPGENLTLLFFQPARRDT